MSINKEKDKIQREAVKTWYNTSGCGTLVLPTGAGKTRCGVLILADHLQYIGGRVLIVTPTSNLRDNEWVNEITKWGFENLLSHVTIECVQSVYKSPYKYCDHTLMIVDEIHTTLSTQYSKIYTMGIPFILGLTATTPGRTEQKKLLKQVAPIRYKLAVQDAIEKELVSPYRLYNIPVRFTKKERASYNIFNQMFNDANSKLNMYIKAFPEEFKGMSAFDLAQEASQNKHHKYYRVGKSFWQGMSMRKWVCYKASRKLDMVLKIIDKWPDKKWIVFSKTTDFADTLHEKLTEKGIKSVSYHSKMKDKERALALEIAKQPETKVICSAEALNAGYDLPAIDGGICASGTATFLTFVQQLGRSLRYVEGKQALFINLYVDYSQEQAWVKKKTYNMGAKWINHINEITWAET